MNRYSKDPFLPPHSSQGYSSKGTSGNTWNSPVHCLSSGPRPAQNLTRTIEWGECAFEASFPDYLFTTS